MRNYKILFLTLIFIVFSSYCCEAGSDVPFDNTEFDFSMEHTIPDQNYKEKFYYKVAKNNEFFGQLEVSQMINNKRVTLRTARIPIGHIIGKYISKHELIKLLNYCNFQEMPKFINLIPSEPITRTVTIFTLKYKNKGKIKMKTVRIQNIDRLFQNNNKNAIRLKMIMLFLEPLEYRTLKDHKFYIKKGIQLDYGD